MFIFLRSLRLDDPTLLTNRRGQTNNTSLAGFWHAKVITYTPRPCILHGSYILHMRKDGQIWRHVDDVSFGNSTNKSYLWCAHFLRRFNFSKGSIIPLPTTGGVRTCISRLPSWGLFLSWVRSLCWQYKFLPQSSWQFRCILVVHCLPRWNAWLLQELKDSCCMYG